MNYNVLFTYRTPIEYWLKPLEFSKTGKKIQFQPVTIHFVSFENTNTMSNFIRIITHKVFWPYHVGDYLKWNLNLYKICDIDNGHCV